MKKNRKYIWMFLRCTAVIAVMAVILAVAGKIYTPYYVPDADQNETFYKTEKNTVDVLIAGSSTLLVGLSPLELWENYGIVAYTRASTLQAPPVTWLNIREAYRYQKPKVVIMGVTSLFLNYNYDKLEPYIRRGLDFKKLTPEKMKTIYDVVKRSDSQHMLDYIFPVFRYHDRWKEFQWTDVENLGRQHDFARGQYLIYKTKEIEPREQVDESVAAEKENEDAWSFYKSAIEYCKSQGSEVIVVYMPDDRWSYGRYLTTKKLVESCGAEYLDFNLENIIQELDLDWEHDFYDPHHLNPVGAQKPTKYLGDYLVENYEELPRYQCSEKTKQGLDADLSEYKAELKTFAEKLQEE